jgi:hypothetical protein
MGELAGLGFSSIILDAIADDWSGFGASSYIILVERSVDKSPDNLAMCADGTLITRAIDILRAMRLVAPGDVTMGPMWLARAARFDVCHGGRTSTGWSIPAAIGGTPYQITSHTDDKVSEMYRNLRHLDQNGYGSGPGNLDLALRSFMSTYDRWPSFADSQLVDTITALEAVLGSDTEITFKLAFRVAGILGHDSSERVSMFTAMKSFYDTRSKLVHGGALKKRHTDVLADVQTARAYARDLLSAFVRLAAVPNPSYGRQFYIEKLDSSLQDEEARLALQQVLGLRAPETDIDDCSE